MFGDKFVRLAVEQEFAFVNDDDPVAYPFDNVQNVRTINDGFAFTSKCLNKSFETDCGVRV